MKKYLFGILAIALAIGFSSFTTKHAKKAKVDTYTFVYTGLSYTSEVAVEDLDNWQEITSAGDPECSSGEVIPCKIFNVPESFTHDQDGTRVLNQSGTVLEIVSALSSGGNRKIDESDDYVAFNSEP